MKDTGYTSTEQVWNDLQATPSYLERFTTTVEIDGEETYFAIQNCCLSCGQINVEDDHECERRAA